MDTHDQIISRSMWFVQLICSDSTRETRRCKGFSKPNYSCQQNASNNCAASDMQVTSAACFTRCMWRVTWCCLFIASNHNYKKNPTVPVHLWTTISNSANGFTMLKHLGSVAYLHKSREDLWTEEFAICHGSKSCLLRQLCPKCIPPPIYLPQIITAANMRHAWYYFQSRV